MPFVASILPRRIRSLDVKQQYFGDARDYFKYDVLERLASDLGAIGRLTCLWMLTAPDGTGQGRVRFIDDPELPELTEFFRERLASNNPLRRRLGQMRSYFANRPFAFVSYRDDRDDFGRGTRAEYFAHVPDEALQRAVVFFDPDVGMEPGRATAHTWSTRRQNRPRRRLMARRRAGARPGSLKLGDQIPSPSLVPTWRLWAAAR